MAIELKVPEAGESIAEIEIGDWLKRAGDHIERDEPLVTLESDKAAMDLPSPISGTLMEVLKEKGQIAKVGEVIARLEANGSAEKPEEKQTKQPEETKPKPKTEQKEIAKPKIISSSAEMAAATQIVAKPPLPVGREHKESFARPKSPKSGEPAQPPIGDEAQPRGGAPKKAAVFQNNREEDSVPMSRLRRTVAERLVQAQNHAALLTTFNEIDMSKVIALRKEHGEVFQKKYGTKLGFMSFFVKASIDALKQFPVLNAEVRASDIVYHNFFDIGIAIGGGKGLVVPVLRNAERMSFAEIEIAIADFAARAQGGALKIEELQGGTFTITNGGIYGSLLSTPIVNPPQSGILGMHTIQERPVARDGQVVIRPMMFIALTYDHRIVDGREAVGFLKRTKDAIENPVRMLVEV